MPRTSGLFAVALIGVLLIGAISFMVIYLRPLALCLGCPIYMQYNPTGSTHTLKTFSSSTGLATQTLTGGPQSWPIGSASSTFTISGPLGPFGTWTATLPSDLSVGPASSYVFTSSYSGTSFLNTQSNAGLWAAEGPSMNNQNPFIINNTFTSSVSAPSACNLASTTNVCKVTWYLNRYYFTVDMKTAGAALNIVCATSCQGYTTLFGLSNQANYDAAFQQAFLTVLSQTNSAAHLTTGTSLSLQLNIPPLLGGQSNVDWAGIIAAFTAPPCTGGSATPVGGGTGSNDLCITSAGAPAAATIVQSAVHTPLKLYVDPGTTQQYLPNFSPFVGVSTYTASQLASVTPSSILGTVYTKIEISDFGAGFSPGPNYSSCGISNFNACWTVSQPEAVLTVLLDVLTSSHVYQQFPTPAPQTGTSAGSFDGQIVDGSLPWKPGVSGATICLTDITGCVNSNGGGNFFMANVAAGQHTVQITAPGFFATGQLSVSVSTGSTFHLGQIALAPQNPWYTGNWCPVPPAYPGAFSICIPWLLVFTLIGAAVLTISIVAFVFSPTRKLDVAAQVAKRLTPTNPLSPKGERFVSRRIAREIRRGHPAKQAQAIAFSQARQKGFKVPPPPGNPSKKTKLSSTQLKVLRGVAQYRKEYKGPASTSDISEVYLKGRKSVSGPTLKSLHDKGFVKHGTSGGWLITPKGRTQTNA